MDVCLVGYLKDIILDIEGLRLLVVLICVILYLLESNLGVLFGFWVKCRFVYYFFYKVVVELFVCYVFIDCGFIFVGLKVGVVVGIWEGK